MKNSNYTSWDRTSDLPICGKVVSLTHRPPLPPEMLLVLISFKGWVDPRAIVRSEGFFVHEKFQLHQLGSNQRPSDLYHSTLTTVPPRSPTSITTSPIYYDYTSSQHVSTLKWPSSESIFDTFQQQVQQNESPDVKFNLGCNLYCVPQQPYDSTVAWLHFTTRYILMLYVPCTVQVLICNINCTCTNIYIYRV